MLREIEGGPRREQRALRVAEKGDRGAVAMSMMTRSRSSTLSREAASTAAKDCLRRIRSATPFR
jgi:hypothetical protein